MPGNIPSLKEIYTKSDIESGKKSKCPASVKGIVITFAQLRALIGTCLLRQKMFEIVLVLR